MVIGFLLLVVGVVVPWLMLLRFVEPSFILSFLAYGSSVGGLFLGLIGALMYSGRWPF
jgi:Co/Zn/Cd efflux system component